MAQSDLVAALRAHEKAEERLDKARADLDEAIRIAVTSGEWQIVDVSKLTGWSRETIRKIVNPPPGDAGKRSLNEPRGARRPRQPRGDA